MLMHFLSTKKTKTIPDPYRLPNPSLSPYCSALPKHCYYAEFFKQRKHNKFPWWGCLGQHWVERYWWNSTSSWNCLKGPTVGIYQAVGNDGCPDCAATYDIRGEACFPWFWQLHTTCHQKSAMFLFRLLTWRKWKANKLYRVPSSIFIGLVTCHETIMNDHRF